MSFMHIIVVEHVVRYNLIIIILFCFLFFPRLDCYLLGDDQIKPLLILEGTHWKFQDCPDRHCYGKRKLNEKEGKEEKRRKNRINKSTHRKRSRFCLRHIMEETGFLPNGSIGLSRNLPLALSLSLSLPRSAIPYASLQYLSLAVTVRHWSLNLRLQVLPISGN